MCGEIGLSDLSDVAQVTFALSPEKLLDKEEDGRGQGYALRTVRRALAQAKPDPLPGDFFQVEEQAVEPAEHRKSIRVVTTV